jgi:hypothetical protein
VNRQRSLFQQGKLKKDRQHDLERIGLKWSVLSTTSWESNFDILVTYAEERKKRSPHGTWDGNVPANYKTESDPPMNLGRWVNRQRSAYAKGRLKEEFVKKLDDIGFRWMIHSRNVRMSGEDGDTGLVFLEGNLVEKSDVVEPLAPIAPTSNSNAIATQQTSCSPSSDIMVPSLPPVGNSVTNSNEIEVQEV